MAKNQSNNESTNLIALLPTILSISSVLFMVGLLGLVLIASKKKTDAIKENFEIRAILQDSANVQDAERLKNKWANNSGIKNILFKDKNIAAKEFEKEIGQEFTTILEVNPIPHVLIITLKAGFSDEVNLKKFEEELKSEKIVEAVDYQKDLLENIKANVRILVIVLLCITALFALISIALINSTIRLSLFAKRFIIKSMQYVGATDLFIMKPFITQFLSYGISSAVIASVALGVIYFGLMQYSTDITNLIGFTALIIVCASLFAIALILVLFSTIFAVKKYLKLENNQLN